MSDTNQRKTLRLPYYDYSQAGAYFVTLVAQRRANLFSEVNQEALKLFPAGEMLAHWWKKLAEYFSGVTPGEFVIMPNHFHGILEFTRDLPNSSLIIDESIADAPNNNNIEDIDPTLSQVMQWFKTMTTNEYIRGVKQSRWEPFDRRLWQRSYFEHIIRNDEDYERICLYIQSNPQQWDMDQENPNNSIK